MASHAERMMALFASSTRSKGIFMPSGKMRTETEPYTLADFEAHIAGTRGLGLVPIDDINLCKWGAIDIDCHGSREKIDLADLWSKIEENGYPLMLCRSKSGGAHLYLFMEATIDAKTMRAMLRLFANRLGFPDAEVFPKQTNMDGVGPDGKPRLGNWINLPYFNAEDTNRYCYIKQPVTLEYFLDTAENTLASQKFLEEVLTGDHSEAPPCVQQMMSGKVPAGYRNEGLWAISVYMKRAFPEDWKNRARDANTLTFEEPLPAKEVETILGSVGKRDYRYRCREEPSKGFCNSGVCVKRKFGIEEKDDPQTETGIQNMTINGLIKIQTDPPVYIVETCGTKVKVNVGILHNPAAMAVAVLEQADTVVFPVKPKDWLMELAKAVEKMTKEEAPEDASPSGLIKVRLREYLLKATPDEESNDREHILHGQPVRFKDEKTEVEWVYFKGSSFVDYLRRTKATELKGPDMWAALRQIGVEPTRMRIGKRVHNLWRAKPEDTPEYKPVETESEY